jgi:glycosyltransferase involved in cell wall biosynthesis
MRLSVIVPATVEAPTLPRCLAAVDAAGPDEVLVANEPAGATPALARNLAAERATGDVLVFVDADVLIHRDALDRIRARLRDPSLDAVFGSYDAAPEAPGAISGFRNLLHHHVHHAGAGRAESFWTGLGAVRRAVFDSAGRLDPQRRYLEDVELGARLFQSGARIELDPAIQGTHLKRYTLASMLHVDTVERAIPWVDLMLAGHAPRSALNAGARHRAAALLALGTTLLLARRRPLPALAALSAFAALNADLYATIARNRGPTEAAAAVPLHVLHHVSATVAIPAGIALHLRRRYSAAT